MPLHCFSKKCSILVTTMKPGPSLVIANPSILPLIDYGDFIYDQDVHYFNNKLRIIYKSPIIVDQYISTLD